MVVNGEPGVRACVTVAVPAMTVGRPTGWGSWEGAESRGPNDSASPSGDGSKGATRREPGSAS